MSAAAIIKEATQRIPLLLQAAIGSEMSDRALSAGFRDGSSKSPFDDATARNSGDKLRIASGRLFRSFGTDSPDNISNIFVTETGAVIEYGTKVPYAAIHEFGGTIGARFVASKGKMHRYFWARYIASGDERFKAMALAVMKNGGVNLPAVTMPKRPFIEPGFQKFEKQYLPGILTGIAQAIMNEALKGG